MKQLIAGLIIGLGVMHGAQADVQSQTFNFAVPADSDTYTSSFALDSFNSSLGTLTGVAWGYSFFSSFDYTITNNGTRTINPITASAQDGSLHVEFVANGYPLFNSNAPISGSNVFGLAPGASVSNTLLATAKGEQNFPFDPLLAQLLNGMTMNATLTVPYFSVAAKNFNNVSVSTGGGDVTGTAYFNYIYDAAPVPEPESYAMMLAGLGLIGAMVGRRKAL